MLQYYVDMKLTAILLNLFFVLLKLTFLNPFVLLLATDNQVIIFLPILIIELFMFILFKRNSKLGKIYNLLFVVNIIITLLLGILIYWKPLFITV